MPTLICDDQYRAGIEEYNWISTITGKPIGFRAYQTDDFSCPVMVDNCNVCFKFWVET